MKIHVKIEFDIEEWVVYFLQGIVGLGLFASCVYWAIIWNLVFAIPAFILLGWTMNRFQKGWDS